MRMCVRARSRVRVCVSLHECLQASVFACMPASVRARVRACVRACVCVCVCVQLSRYSQRWLKFVCLVCNQLTSNAPRQSTARTNFQPLAHLAFSFALALRALFSQSTCLRMAPRLSVYTVRKHCRLKRHLS